MAGVAEYCRILHFFKMPACYYRAAAGDRYKKIAYYGGVIHRHYLKAVHNRFDCLYRVDFGDYYRGAQSLCPHGDAFAAPSISGDNNGFSGYYEVGGSVDSVKDRLAGSVSVVKKMFAVGVVYVHHRELKLAVFLHFFKPCYSGGRLLASAQNLGQQLPEPCMH